MVFKYPYTDMYALNLDWMIQAIKEVQQIIEALGSVVHTFNNRDGNVELLAADVNGLDIEILHRLGPGVVFNNLSEAQLELMYDAGVRIVLEQNTQGIYYRQYILLKIGSTVVGTEYLPVPGETQVLSFNERTGDVSLLAADVNDLHINFVYTILDAMSGHTEDFKTWYNTGIRFVQEKNGGVENWYYLTSTGSGDGQTVSATIYDPLKGRGLVKSVEGNTPDANGAVVIPAMVKKVNDKSPVSGNVYVYGTDIDMANDDDTNVETAINNNETKIENTQNSIAYVENGNTATNNIAAGQYVLWKDSLYTAKNNIAIGATLSSTNLEAISSGGFNNLLGFIKTEFNKTRILFAIPLGKQVKITFSQNDGNIYALAMMRTWNAYEAKSVLINGYSQLIGSRLEITELQVSNPDYYPIEIGSYSITFKYTGSVLREKYVALDILLNTYNSYTITEEDLTT